MTKSAIVIYNPRSGKQQQREMIVADFAKSLAARGFNVQTWRTERANHATELARQAVEAKADLLVAHGGDGTLNEVLQGMVGSELPLAIWPGGTANVVALDLKLPRQPQDIIELICANHQARVHVAKAGTRYYFFTAGIGLDAEIIEEVDAQLKKQIGKGAFWLAGFAHLVKWQPTPIILKIDGRTYEGTFAVIGKSFGYGGTLSLTPHASLDDESLDVCIFTGTSKIQYLSYLVSCIQKKQLDRQGVIYLKTRRVEASSPVRLPVQADGELVGNLPMTFEVVPNAITLFVPPGTFAR